VHAIATTPFRRVTTGKLIRPATSRAVPRQRILAVEFVSDDGRTWKAIGGGVTLAAAIASASECCPDDTIWHPVDWNDLYGD
jgi:hypothetical protein